MKIAGIPVVVKNGRVKAKAREHWRLVLTGQEICTGDQYRSIACETWNTTTRAGERVEKINESRYRRRV